MTMIKQPINEKLKIEKRKNLGIFNKNNNKNAIDSADRRAALSDPEVFSLSWTAQYMVSENKLFRNLPLSFYNNIEHMLYPSARNENSKITGNYYRSFCFFFIYPCII